MSEHDCLQNRLMESGDSACASVLPLDERMTHVMHTVRVILRTMLHAKSESDLLRGLCHNIIEEGCFLQAGIALADENAGQRICWAAWVCSDGNAASSIDLDILNSLELTLDDERASNSVVGKAMSTRQPCIRQPLLAGPALEHGLQSFQQHAKHANCSELTAMPMMNGAELVGALFVGSPKPGVTEEDSLSFLITLADDLAQGILAARLRERHEIARRTIERLAFYDGVTGLPNRTRYLIALQEVIDQRKGEQHPIALMHIKLVRLGEICEILGHSVAEHLIRQIACRLTQINIDCLGLARIADTNFALVLQVDDADAAKIFAHILLNQLSEGIVVDGIVVNTPLQIGAVLHQGSDVDARELDRRAESALRHEGGAVRFYAGVKDKENAIALALTGDLQRTIRGDGLEVYYQPKVNIRSGEVVGAEALVRWHHPLHGNIAPSRFIRLAESSDMISQLTGWLLNTAQIQLKEWQKRGVHFTLAINVSAHDLQNTALMERIEELARSGIDPALVQFELTESVLVDDPISARRSLDRLKQLGFELAIDDFGTGFAGLSYLQNFPVDCIKIDQSFVMQMLSSRSAEAIVRSTIDLGHQLGHTMIAEGIENGAVWELLRGFGCDLGQGYLVSKPMPANDFIAWSDAWTARRDWQRWGCAATAQATTGIPA